MADVSITAANVIAGAGISATHGIAGETITAGKVVYRDPADQKFKLADSNSATVAARSPFGIALNGASANQPLAVHKRGPLTVGGTLVAGTTYALSETAGGIQPIADLGSGEYVSILGIATSTSVLNVDIQESGVAL